MEKSTAFESTERAPKTLFRVILMRHEEPFYKNEGHDLTDQGVLNAIKSGEKMRDEQFFSDEYPIHLYHSPRARAEGTLDFVAQGAGINTENKRAVQVINQSKIVDNDVFMNRVKELEHNPEKIAEDHYKHEMHRNRPDIIEPHEHKRERLFRAMEYLIRSILKNLDRDKSSATQVFAVSHFEIITHLVDGVFGIENLDGYNSPSFGEQVKIIAYETEDSNKVLLDVSFRDLEKKVIFNRTKRLIEEIA